MRPVHRLAFLIPLTLTTAFTVAADEKKPGPLPDDAKGFDGRVEGYIDRVGDNHRAVTLTVTKIISVATTSTAKDPQSLLGKTVAIWAKSEAVGAEGKMRVDPEQIAYIKGLKKGETAQFNIADNHNQLAITTLAVPPVQQPVAQAPVPATPATPPTPATPTIPAAPAPAPSVTAIPAGGVPTELAGFDGTVEGTVVTPATAADGPTITVTRILHTNQRSTAADANAVVGKTVKVSARSADAEQTAFLSTIKPGQPVQLDVAEQAGFFNVADLTTAQKAAAGAVTAAAQQALPAELKGFNGTLEGTVVSIGDQGNAVTMQVGKVIHVNTGSTASKPESAVGKTITITAGSTDAQQSGFLRSIKPGQNLQLDVAEASDQLHIAELTTAQKAAAIQQPSPTTPAKAN